MNIKDAKGIAKKIHGNTSPVDYRNVWGFFPDTDSEPVIFITKDNSKSSLSGAFLDDGKHDGFIDYITGAEVSAYDVFGEAFYSGDSSLLVDTISSERQSLQERIGALRDIVEKELPKHRMHPLASLMLEDAIDCEETEPSVVYKRLLVLSNYLLKHSEDITVTEFAYMHQELFLL